MLFTFHTDPGHGWLEVPKHLVKRLKVRVSQFSYWDSENYYLEEDCDAPRFLDALKANGIEYKSVHKHTDYDSPIRDKWRG